MAEDVTVQCPFLFNNLKIVLDNTDGYGNFYLTGSQKLHLMKGVSESLAGRVSVVELEALSLREIYDIPFTKHFVPTQEYIKEREGTLRDYRSHLWETIHRGSYPELYSNPGREWVDFYQSYVKTYLERDVNQLLKGKNHLAFVKFDLICFCAPVQSLLTFLRPYAIIQSTV